ncbi:MAG: HupE/UreJ family protein [Pseudomonadota bacterium]
MFKLLSALVLKLSLALAVSTLAPVSAQAHEVVPTVGDVSADGATLRLELRVNLEALLAGVNLTRYADTNDAPEAAAYDALRALAGPELAADAGSLLPEWNAVPLVSVDGVPVALSLRSAEVIAEDGIELPRATMMVLEGALPGAAEAVTVTWPADAGALILRQQGVAAPFTGLLTPGAPSAPISLSGGGAANGWQTFAAYIPVGFDHIVPKGLDHILFVLGLFFLSTQLGPLLWQVTAFTLAHSVTLALAALGLVNIPGSIVEPLIAASIVYVAIENILARGLTPWRPWIVFAFGLLHGLGFASVLGEFGLPEGQFVPALIGFNVGVEVGQLAVIAAAAILLWLGARAAQIANLPAKEDMVGDYVVMHRAFAMTGSLLIAGIAIYWVIERTLL